MPVSEFRETGHHGRKIIRIRFLQCIQEVLNGASSRAGFIKFYGEFYLMSTSILMYFDIRDVIDK